MRSVVTAIVQGLLSSQARGESPGQCSLDNCAGDELAEKLVNPENILLGGTDEETLIRNLIDWQQGFLSNKIEIRRGEYGVGVYALENLEENEELFTSNNEYIIKLDRALKSLDGKVAVNKDYKLDCTDTLSLFIAVEIKKGDESEVWPYLATMPLSYITPLEYWPESMIDFLTPTGKDLAESSTEDFKIRWERIQKIYNSKNPGNTLTRDEFHHAYSIVFTRYFTDEEPEDFPDWFHEDSGCGSLGPVFDFWNHDNPPNADWFVDDGMEIKTSEPVPAGAELFISYGDNALQNGKLAQSYGFTFSDSEKLFEVVHFYEEELIQACLQRLGMSERICETKTRLALEMNEDDAGFLDGDCHLKSSALEYIASGDPRAITDKDAHKNSQDARSLRLALWIVYQRIMNLDKLADAMNSHQFSSAQEIYHQMARNMLNSEMHVLELCIDYLEEDALKLERSSMSEERRNDLQ